MSTSRSRLAATSRRIGSSFRDDAGSDPELSPLNESVPELGPAQDRRRRIAEREELDDWLAAEAEEDESDPEQAPR